MRFLRGLLRSRYSLAVIAGLLLAAAFPKVSISGFAWVAPGLILAAALGRSRGECFRIGYVAGFTYYLASLYWLLLIPYQWHGIPLGPAAGWLSLSAFLALFPGLWTWITCISTKQAEATNAGPPTFIETIAQIRQGPLAESWLDRTAWSFKAAITWVAIEMVIARIFTGFPWDLLGVSQYRLIPLIQVASITGVYGVSFLVVWISASLVSAMLSVFRRPQLRSAWLSEIILPGLMIVLLFVFGFHRLANPKASTRTLGVTLIQPSIPQTLIWDEGSADLRFAELLRISQLALTNETDLLLWPEAAVPKLLRWDPQTFHAVTNLAGEHHVWMIIGADDLEQQRAVSDGTIKREVYNSSFLISDDGRLMDRYRKRSLVIFGEYIPLVTWLPFIKYFTPIESGFTRGDKAVPFKLGQREVTTSVLICFEDTFPHLAREYADDDTDFLVNLTNNGWFGEGAAQWQHATTAVFRAVENGLPLVRCANNGLTCWVDAYGRVRDTFRDKRGTVYGQGFMRARIPLLEKGEKREGTFYNRHGDVFGWSCVLLTGVIVLTRFKPLRRQDA